MPVNALNAGESATEMGYFMEADKVCRLSNGAAPLMGAQSTLPRSGHKYSVGVSRCCLCTQPLLAGGVVYQHKERRRAVLAECRQISASAERQELRVMRARTVIMTAGCTLVIN